MCCKYICPIYAMLFVLSYNVFCSVEVGFLKLKKSVDKFISLLWLVVFFILRYFSLSPGHENVLYFLLKYLKLCFSDLGFQFT